MNSYEFGKTSDGSAVNAYIIENINGIRGYLKNRYPLIKHYKEVTAPKSSIVEEIMDDIYNPDCDFDQKKLFKGEERIK